ncbi:MAG: alpha/beta hydrolase [Pseudomonadota bacterium]
MTNSNGVVLIHGAWHDHHTWDAVIPLIEAEGYVAKAIDLPGAGKTAPRPSSFNMRPLDPAAFGTEPSPNAGVTQGERTKATIHAVREVNAKTGGKAVLVGHSLGGVTISSVVEEISDEVSAVVYLTALMLPPGMLPAQMIQHELMAEALVPPLFMADPQQVGALRIDAASPDPEYRQKLRNAFYADLSDAQFETAAQHLHPDEPAQVVAVPSNVSKERFGSVSRHYIECTNDQAITHAGQREMIRLMDEAMATDTVLHRLDTSHSPFHSQPDAVASILTGIAKS